MEKEIQRKVLQQKKHASIGACNHQKTAVELLSLFTKLNIKTKKVISFTPLPDEPDISLINEYLSKKCEQFILIPCEKHPSIPDNINDFDAIIIPMQGFDRTGNRMGRGGGWYDRFLQKIPAENPKIQKIGVCFSYLELPAISAEKHDIKMDIILTEKEIIRTH